jgi:predicted RNA-binding protein with PIN domain
MPTLSLEDPNDEDKLVTLLRSYQAHTGTAITVVFDPGGGVLAQTQRIGSVEVVFASPGSTADAVITRRIRTSHDPRGWLVVTSDQQLARAVSRQGARVQSATAFAAQLDRPTEAPPEWREKPPSSDEVEAWLSLFENGAQQGE